ncbi:MAG: hypothetical protein ACYCVD_08165 [Desulfitobacteriaceae bacterium]
MTMSFRSFKERSRKEQISTIIGTLSSIVGISLWTILVFANPYTTNDTTDISAKITFVRLGLPAVGGLVASIFNQVWLMCIVLFGSLPFYFYMAGTPSIFKLYGVVWLGFSISAILMVIGKRQRH